VSLPTRSIDGNRCQQRRNGRIGDGSSSATQEAQTPRRAYRQAEPPETPAEPHGSAFTRTPETRHAHARRLHARVRAKPLHPAAPFWMERARAQNCAFPLSLRYVRIGGVRVSIEDLHCAAPSPRVARRGGSPISGGILTQGALSHSIASRSFPSRPTSQAIQRCAAARWTGRWITTRCGALHQVASTSECHGQPSRYQAQRRTCSLPSFFRTEALRCRTN
jgi:hypothetical protein